MNSEFLQDKEIIVASNRGPVLFKRDGKGRLELIRGLGGDSWLNDTLHEKNTCKMGFFRNRGM